MLKIEIKNGLLLKHTGYLVAHLLCYRNSLYWEENVLRQQQIPSGIDAAAAAAAAVATAAAVQNK